VSQHELALGMLLIVAFSTGLAATLTGLGVLVVRASGVLARVAPAGRLTSALPALSALVIVIAGVVVTTRAIPALV
jgi:ABC-type nickel/cobalt efflux system permease component RcnA